MEKEIRIKSIKDVESISTIFAKYYFDIELHTEHNVIDAKSILGICTIPFNSPIKVVVKDNVNYKNLFQDLDNYAPKNNKFS